MMRIRLGLLLLGVQLAIPACAPKTIAVPVNTAPRFPDFVRPRIPADLAGLPAVANQERAWQFLQAGDFRNADREVDAGLKSSPGFYPAETTGGYVELAQKNARAALTRFDRALVRRADYAAALAGKGEALSLLSRDQEAIDAFQAAVNADPSLLDIPRRIEILKFRTVQGDVAAARQAARAGKPDDAIQAYQVAIAHSPDTGFLYRELAAIERDRGDTTSALEHLRKAASLDPSDAASLGQVAELLEATGDLEGALQTYNAVLAIDADPAADAKRTALLTRIELARLPAEYRAIAAAAQITRADLAALIGVQLAPLLDVTPARDVGVITDIRGHWAEHWMLAAAGAGILDPFANHTFQPRTVVRRVDFALAVTRLLAKVGIVAPAQARRWSNARGRFSDVDAGHLAYPAASMATAAGVMTTSGDGAFEPSRLVTGAEAIDALEKLRALANLPTSANAIRR